MTSNTKLRIIFVIVLGFVLAGIFFLNYLEARSSAQLSLLLEEIKIGLRLPEVIKKLGEPARVLTKAEDVEKWGTIKDKKVVEECNLYMFPYWGMPHKYILVYVDKDSNEVCIVEVEPM
jgi:hypothetical protein